MNKKLIAASVLAAAAALTLTACGSSGASSGTASGAASAPKAAVSQDLGKTLVVYYSASGRTKKAAQDIAEATHADIMELVPNPQYTDADLNYRDNNSRVMKEHNDPSLQKNIQLEKAVPDNWADYKTVFVGYPIWWGIAAWPVNTFITSNDFTGKTVIPFATSYSSGLGDSVNLLKGEAKGGDWKEGQIFKKDATKQDVVNWVNSGKF